MTELTKILHIEDDPEILQITGMALELVGGFTIQQADRGEKALGIFREFGPQLILSDVQMPGLTGPETVAQIRQTPGWENVPAVFLTARLMDGGAGLLVHPRDLAVVPKPFDPATLSDELRRIWSEAEAKAA